MKPDRVDNIPMVEPDQTPYQPAQLNLDLATAGNFPTCNCLTRDITIREEFNADTWVFDGLTLTNTANHQCWAFGVLLNGANTADYGDKVLYTINGNLNYMISTTQVMKIIPIIGRYPTAPVATQTHGGQYDPTAITKFNAIPAFNGTDSLLQGNCSVSKTVCLGNWSAGSTLTDFALFFGFMIMMELGANTTFWATGSVSAHKYIKKISIFDPEK